MSCLGFYNPLKNIIGLFNTDITNSFFAIPINKEDNDEVTGPIISKKHLNCKLIHLRKLNEFFFESLKIPVLPSLYKLFFCLEKFVIKNSHFFVV